MWKRHRSSAATQFRVYHCVTSGAAHLSEIFSYTIDNRGAAFSSSGNILAICEDQNVIGFWRTSDGECMGRVIFQTAARGCVVDGATGLPPEFAMANSDGKDGWIVERTS